MTQPWEFNGVVRLTRVGTTYILATIVLAIAALNTGNNALYIGVSFMLGCLLLSGMASKSGLRHLEVEIENIDEAWAGREVEGVLRVRNHSRLWSVRDVLFVSEDLAAPVYVPLLPRRASLAVPAPFLFEHRGLVTLKTLDSYTRYPFGFILKKRRLRVHGEVVVYPRLLQDEFARERFRAIEGEQTTSSRPGGGTEIHSFRDYVRGDSLRHVYWKKSASHGRWITKQSAAEAAHSVHVVVDAFKPRGVSHDEYETMISEAATFIFDASQRGYDITMTLPRSVVRTREGQPATPHFRALALLEPMYEPLEYVVDRSAVVFSVAGGRHDAQSA